MPKRKLPEKESRNVLHADLESDEEEEPVFLPPGATDFGYSWVWSDEYDFSIVCDRLWVGSEEASTHERFLKEQHIGLIIGVGVPAAAASELGIKCVSLGEFPDSPKSDIYRHFGKAYRMISSWLKEEKTSILVHCQVGLSRSVTVWMA